MRSSNKVLATTIIRSEAINLDVDPGQLVIQYKNRTTHVDDGFRLTENCNDWDDVYMDALHTILDL